MLKFVQCRVILRVLAISNMFSQGGVFDNARISSILRSRGDGYEGWQGDGFDDMMKAGRSSGGAPAVTGGGI